MMPCAVPIKDPESLWSLLITHFPGTSLLESSVVNELAQLKGMRSLNLFLTLAKSKQITDQVEMSCFYKYWHMHLCKNLQSTEGKNLNFSLSRTYKCLCLTKGFKLLLQPTGTSPVSLVPPSTHISTKSDHYPPGASRVAWCLQPKFTVHVSYQNQVNEHEVSAQGHGPGLNGHGEFSHQLLAFYWLASGECHAGHW